MPANLPPQYHKAEYEFRAASTPGDRLEKLREMYRLLPKHKGTEKLQSDLKQKISRLKDELEVPKGSGKKVGVSYRVPHEGAGQISLVGAAEHGKERTPGKSDPRASRNCCLSVHDQITTTGNHDVGGCARPACRSAAHLP